MDSPAFHLKPCVIAGETRPGDYSVVTEDGETFDIERELIEQTLIRTFRR